MLKIVIVEDEEFIRKGLVYTIDWLSMGCVVVADAADGQEGLEKIIENQPDVVITDIKMPKMDGIEMVRQALQHTEFTCIILTSYSEFEYAKKAIELKVFEYLVKPIDEEEIKRIMESLQDELKQKRQVKLMLESAKTLSSKIDINSFIQYTNSDCECVAKAVHKIQEKYADKISVETIADELGISSRYLSRKFKEVTDRSFLDLLNWYRVQQAIKLLETGRYRVYEISDITGFSDYKHFCTVFKRYTMMSPTAFVNRKT